VVTVAVGAFVVSLDLLIVNIAFPDIQKSFPGSSLSELSWTLNAYAILFGALLVPAGRWADRAGRKHAFLVGLTVFTVASAACSAAPSVLALVIARAVQGIGAAMLFPASLGLLLLEWPEEKRGVPTGIWAAVSGVAAAAAPPLGGLLVQAGWRWVFIVNLPIGLAALLAGWRLLINRRDERTTGRPDAVGAVVFTAAVAALILAIVQGQSWGWGGSRVIGLFAATGVLMAIVGLRSARHPLPLIEPTIVRTRAIAWANLSSIFFYMAFATLVLGMVLFQTMVWQESALRAGLQLAPGPLATAICAVPGGLLGQRFGQRYVGAAGALLFGLGILWFRSRAGLEPDFAGTLLPSALVGGAGMGLVLPALAAAGTGPLPPSRFATGAAILGMTRQVGSALGVALFVAILGQPTRETVVADFRDVWSFMMVCLICAAAGLLAMGPVENREAGDENGEAGASVRTRPAGAVATSR